MPLIRLNHQIKQRKWDSTKKKFHLINRGKNSTEILFRAGFSSHFLWWKPYYSIFSQVPPFCAIFHLFPTKAYLFSQLFSLYDMSEAGWGHFQNQPFGLYLLNSWTNFEDCYRCTIHFIPDFSQQHWFGFYLAQSLEIFSLWAKFGVGAKFPRQSLFLGINIPT